MVPSDKLLDFFRAEFVSEHRSDFARLKRVPDSHVEESLRYFESLSPPVQVSFIDCCAHWACANYSFILGVPQIDHTQHPFFSAWKDLNARFRFRSLRDGRHLQAAVRQYRMDEKRGVRSCVSEEEFQFALSVKGLKAPENRKRVRAALANMG